MIKLKIEDIIVDNDEGGYETTSVAEFNGGYSHLIEDDHCWLVVNGGGTSAWIFEEAVEVLKQLPNSPDDYEPLQKHVKKLQSSERRTIKCKWTMTTDDIKREYDMKGKIKFLIESGWKDEDIIWAIQTWEEQKKILSESKQEKLKRYKKELDFAEKNNQKEVAKKIREDIKELEGSIQAQFAPSILMRDLTEEKQKETIKWWEEEGKEEFIEAHKNGQDVKVGIFKPINRQFIL